MDIANDFNVNYQTGWIKLFRSIKNHWLFPKSRPFTPFEAWIFILIEVNHNGEKCVFGYDILDCPRGDKLYSFDTWAKKFNWNKSKVRRFFNLLQKDNMIVLKSEQKTTRLTVCNYDSYQSYRNANETQVKRKRNASETQVTPIKELKNEKNEKKEYTYNQFYDEQLKLSENNSDYEKAIKVLFGENTLKHPLDKVLKMEKQLTWEQFKSMMRLKKEYSISIRDILEDMQEWPNLKKRTEVLGTFRTFVKRAKK